jgi:hypothetical protein
MNVIKAVYRFAYTAFPMGASFWLILSPNKETVVIGACIAAIVTQLSYLETR